MNTQATTADVAVFSRLPWHDSEFLGWTYGPDDETGVTFDVAFRSSELVRGRTAVRFHECRGFYADVDLLAKTLCGDQIASAYYENAATTQIPFVKLMKDRFDLYRGDSLDGLFAFGVTLVHPSGQIIVVARSFSLSSSVTPGDVEAPPA